MNPLPGKGRKPFDIFEFSFRHGALILVLSAFVLTMLVPLVLLLRQPNYEVSSMIKIDPVIQSMITKSEEPSITGYYHDFVRTQVLRIKEHEIFLEAIKQLTPKEHAALFPPDLPLDNCVSLLQLWLNTKQVSRTHLIKLTIQSPRKEGLAPILNRVMDVYLKSMQDEQEQKDNRRLDYLNKKVNSLKERITSREQQLKDIARATFSSTFSENYNIWQQRLTSLQEAYISDYKVRVAAENAYLYGKKKEEELQKLSLSPLVEKGVIDNQAVNFTSSWTYQQLQEMRRSIDGVTVENDDRKRVEERMDAMRDYEQTLRKETRDNTSYIIYGQRDLDIKQDLILRKNTFDEARANEKDLALKLEETMKLSSENSIRLVDGRDLSSELEHDRELLFRLDTRIHELEIESRAPLRVAVDTYARPPKSATGSNVKKLLFVCLALSFGSVGGLFMLIELGDNRIRTVNNIAQALGCPPTWPISRAPEHISFTHVLGQAPESVTAKALRSLATRLFREQQVNQAKVFLFTGVDSGNGTTTITQNVAYALVGQSEKVLLIDANLQAWDTAGLNEVGNAVVKECAADVEGKTDENQISVEALFECIQHDPEKKYDVLIPYIPKISNRATSRLFGALIQMARERYDFICIDTTPVLQSDLTEYLAVHSDVVVLISQGESTLYRDLRRSAEILVRLEIPALAPVLNWGGQRKIPRHELYVNLVSSRLARIVNRLSLAGRFSRREIDE